MRIKFCFERATINLPAKVYGNMHKKMQKTCLQKISNINYESPRNRCNINPFILIKDLEATDMVLEKHCEEIVIRILVQDKEDNNGQEQVILQHNPYLLDGLDSDLLAFDNGLDSYSINISLQK